MQQGNAQEVATKSGFLKKTLNILKDPGFLFTLGNAFLLPSPFTIGATALIASMLSVNNLPETKSQNKAMRALRKVCATPHLGLLIAGAALVPIAAASFLAVPWAGATAVSLLSSTAFLSGAASSCFVAFDLMKPMEDRKLLKPFKSDNPIKRVANVFLKPETYSALGMMAVSSMAGPVGFFMWPIIGVSTAITVVNSQKESYSNAGRPKLWMAGACGLNSIAATVTLNPFAALANLSYANAYVSLETMEPDDFAGKMRHIVKKTKALFKPSKKKSKATANQPAPAIVPRIVSAPARKPIVPSISDSFSEHNKPAAVVTKKGKRKSLKPQNT